MALKKKKAMKKKGAVLKRPSLKKEDLDKLGAASLAEKIQKATENNETPEEAAADFKKSLSKVEHSRVWSTKHG